VQIRTPRPSFQKMLRNLDVCLLQPREVALFERYGQRPKCEAGIHVHIPLHEARRREADGHGRFVDERNRYMAAEPSRVWSPKYSGPVRVQQLVRGCVRGRSGQFRTSAPALGARGRNTSVLDTNYVPPEKAERAGKS
jgi:hypothetical protein